ncbi:hypothetical protein [Wenxinia saemankumensis]|uniref:Uncharacterized protein n=1 Tax=Wenxinia saemankumensis TaxID=1447782 RepID=A0A1M6AMG0_9RHOB|nr:hypothetical protein [Wenxinia saemankumensis]SHI37704.1 hypothetical protein SAMN05444417_0519 [Wenxinia saemankumensis]
MRSVILALVAVLIALAGWWVWASGSADVEQAGTQAAEDVATAAEVVGDTAETTGEAVLDAAGDEAAGAAAADGSAGEEGPVAANVTAPDAPSDVDSAATEEVGAAPDAAEVGPIARMTPQEAVRPGNFDAAELIALVRESDLDAEAQADLIGRIEGAEQNAALQEAVQQDIRAALEI